MDYSKILKGLVGLNAAIPRALMDGKAFMPVQCMIGPTQNCNLRCTYCFEPGYLEFKKKAKIVDDPLSTEQFQSLVSEFSRKTLITWAGGEAFLVPDIMDLLGHTARRHYTHLITNGTLIGDEAVRELVAMAPRSIFHPGLILVGFSVHSLSDEFDPVTQTKGFYSKVSRAMQLLAEERKRQGKAFPKINVKKVVVAETVGQIGTLYDRAVEIGADAFNVLLHNTVQTHSRIEHDGDRELAERAPRAAPFDLGLLAEQLDYIHEKNRQHKLHVRYTPAVPRTEFEKHYSGGMDLDDYGCHAPWSRVMISTYGDVFPCPNVNVGNIREAGFRSVWNGDKARQFRRELKTNKIFPLCEGCCHLEYQGPDRSGARPGPATAAPREKVVEAQKRCPQADEL